MDTAAVVAPGGAAGGRLLRRLAGLAALVLIAVSSSPTWLPYVGADAVVVQTGSMQPALPIGSLLLLGSPAAPAVGDVVTFVRPDLPVRLITHRVVAIERAGTETLLRTKGDANGAVDGWPVPLSAVEGRVTASVPVLGSVLTAVSSGWGRAGIFVFFAALVLWPHASTRRQARPADG